jgi:hypothetical protein
MHPSIKHLEETLFAKGFDLFHTFPLRSASPSSCGILVGNSKRLWEKFVQHVQKQDPRLLSGDLLDFYTKSTMESACCSSFSDISAYYDVYYTFQTFPFIVPFQKLADMTGFAYFDPKSYLCCHPVYGRWFAMRSLILVDFEKNSSNIHELMEDLNAYQHSSNNVKKCACLVNPPEFEIDWRSASIEDLVNMRDVCAVGKPHKYCQDQIDYHYSDKEGRRKVISRIRNETLED